MSDKPDAEGGKAENLNEENPITLDLDFAPSWARTDPSANIERYRKDEYQSEERTDRPDRSRDRRDQDRRPRRREFDGERSDSPRPPRRPRRDSEFPPRRDFRDSPHPASHAPQGERRAPEDRPHGDRRNGGRRPDGGRPPRREYLPPLPLEIRVLPEQKALGAVIRKIQTTRRAFPLRDLVMLFLNNPNSCQFRIEPRKEEKLQLFQCKMCGMPALTEEEIRQHILTCHMEECFEVEEVECEPPSGQFVCVARCGLSGELLGPPNHHSFSAKVHEMLRTRFSNMSEESYRSRIEMVRDPEVIEEWRKQCTKKKLYRRKVDTAAPAPKPPEEGAEAGSAAEEQPKPQGVEREMAESIFQREILPQQISTPRHMLCPVTVALKTPSRQLHFQLQNIFSREQRGASITLSLALRGAFRHRSLQLFRANEPHGMEFVQQTKPAPLESEHLVPALRDVLEFIQTHPGCQKQEMLDALSPENQPERTKELLAHLAWLVEKGHVIWFFNDTLCGPIDYPVFHHQKTDKPNAKKEAPAEPASAPAEEAQPFAAEPAAETQSADESAEAEVLQGGVPVADPAPAVEPSAAEVPPPAEPSAPADEASAESAPAPETVHADPAAPEKSE
ncbi:MAG: hypothetical protein IJR99_17100 [Kiritimatiellae bacterium]|nr:hypothetical protein [Kiritimatiellia bacterium]